MQGLLISECDCCGKDTPMDNLKIVCKECYNSIKHVHDTNSLFKCDWEGDDDDSTTNNDNH